MKIALVGGGGVRTMYFTEAVAKYADRLGVTQISIMDNNEEKLEIFGNMAKYVARKANEALKIDLTTSLIEAVTDADYVVTTMRVGGDEGRVKDERIALKHGVIGQETTGAGGFAFAIRTIPVMLEYCKIIKEHSNNAVIFNFTNPAGLVTQAMHANGFTNVLGVCDNPTTLKTEVAHALGLGVNSISTRMYGLNHLSWMDSIKIKGVEVIDKLLASDAFLESSWEFGYFDKELIQMLGQIPNGYLYYFYYSEKALKNILSSNQSRGEVIRDINSRMIKRLKEIDVKKNPEEAIEAYQKFLHEREGSYMSIELAGKKLQSKPFDLSTLSIEGLQQVEEEGENFEGYAGVAFNYIEAVKNNTSMEIPLNVANNGAIPGLKDEDVVELTCIVDKDGAHPIRVETIPENNMLLINVIKRYENLTVEAIKNRSKELAVQALMIHPLVNSYSLAKNLVEDYLEAHKEFVGDWN
ncbi:glycoside hydrolase [Neobacillus sp. NPDC093127]|uniref:family 4 glycosyl hydrolase n=1 Tax=Neobacillus sp. NPDC093127 TaxID=3364296 RepID=UPI00380639CB